MQKFIILFMKIPNGVSSNQYVRMESSKASSSESLDPKGSREIITFILKFTGKGAIVYYNMIRMLSKNRGDATLVNSAHFGSSVIFIVCQYNTHQFNFLKYYLQMTTV